MDLIFIFSVLLVKSSPSLRGQNNETNMIQTGSKILRLLYCKFVCKMRGGGGEEGGGAAEQECHNAITTLAIFDGVLSLVDSDIHSPKLATFRSN